MEVEGFFEADLEAVERGVAFVLWDLGVGGRFVGSGRRRRGRGGGKKGSRDAKAFPGVDLAFLFRFFVFGFFGEVDVLVPKRCCVRVARRQR